MTVGGFTLPEPRPDPLPEPEENTILDPDAEDDGTSDDQEFLAQTGQGGATAQPFATPAFGGYDSGGNGTSAGGGGAERAAANRVSVEA